MKSLQVLNQITLVYPTDSTEFQLQLKPLAKGSHANVFQIIQGSRQLGTQKALFSGSQSSQLIGRCFSPLFAQQIWGNKQMVALG